jgi:hypothetical protein
VTAARAIFRAGTPNFTAMSVFPSPAINIGPIAVSTWL